MEYDSDVESLYKQLKLLNDKPKRISQKLADELTDPAPQPLYWIAKWVDYSEKYGFGYQLSDGSSGITFNDSTELVLFHNGLNVHYIDCTGAEEYMTTETYPHPMEKKMKLILYFKRYMSEHLQRAGGGRCWRSVDGVGDPLSRVPHLKTWFRTTRAVVMHLSNGSIQLNFIDHFKLILCPRISTVTMIDTKSKLRTYKFSTIKDNGCTARLYEQLRYAQEILKMRPLTGRKRTGRSGRVWFAN